MLFDYSIIIPTFKRATHLRVCLAALEPQLIPETEVIVCDDAWDGDLQMQLMEAYPDIQYLKGPKCGPAANRCAGARVAQGEWLIFLDDDCIAQTGWLDGFRGAIAAQPAVDVWEGRVLADQPRTALWQASPLNPTGGCFWSCNLAIRASAYRAVGGFDPTMPYAAYEDIELTTRLKKAQYAMGFAREALVIHPWRETSALYRAKILYPSVLAFLQRHPEHYSKHTALSYFRFAGAAFKNLVLRDVWRCKGRGLGSALIEIASLIVFGMYMSAYPFFKKKRKCAEVPRS